jgi:hypothetical protein
MAESWDESWDESCRFTRRGLLMLVSGAYLRSGFRLYAAESEFWNKKDPSQWSSDEIEKLKTKSPWAKPVSISVRQSGNGGGSGYPGGGGGYPGGGMGGGGMGRGRRGGMGGPAPIQYHGVVRWVSAKPIQEALKSPVPEGLANAYTISVSGIPILTADRQRSDEGDSDSRAKGPSQDVLDRIKNLTYLEPKGKPPAQPGTVQQGTAGFESNVLLFGFSHELLQLTPEDKEVSFTTQLGRLEVKTKFNLKEMTYHKELAL